MSDLTSDPERFTLRQAAQARDDFAMIMDELDFMKAQISRLCRFSRPLGGHIAAIRTALRRFGARLK
jgi:hypothetical protein